MDEQKEILKCEIRYAQRLCQRTARLYRRIQTTATFLSLVAGSAALVSVSAQLASWMTITAGALFAVFTAINYAIRPADKVALNEVDVKKYAVILTKAESISASDLRALIAEARQTDAPEVEPLRDVAFNDVMYEINRADSLIPLSRMQRFIGALA